jgi:flavin reductase (DIM6/NTAB) family NADH-FMN oxidoreductase RutF
VTGPAPRADEKTTFDLAEVESADRYKLLMGLVVPRPIAWVATVSPDGVPNLAPYSYFNLVAGTPPIVFFAPRTREPMKDSLANVRVVGEFTLNIVTEELAEAMVLTSGDYPPEVDEFQMSGLTAVPADVVSAPMVDEAKANLECRVTQIVEIGPRPGEGASAVFGEVVRVHVRRDVLDGTRIDHRALRAVGRMAGDAYATTTDLFHIARPD